MVVGISKIALHSRYQRVFISQSLKILNIFNTLTKKWELSSKDWSTYFLLKVVRLKTQHFHTKRLCQKPMLGRIE